MGSNNPENRNPNSGVKYSGSAQESGQVIQVQTGSIAGSLTFPTGNEASSQSGPVQSASSQQSTTRLPVQPRPPRNLQGLLKFAMEATQAEDAPGNMEVGPMDEQRRQFLEEAIRSLTVNVPEVLDNAIKVLTNTGRMNDIKMNQPLPDEVKNSFTILLDHVDDLDVANDFFKMGGFAMFPICYSSENEELRSRASSVLGTLCQNNPFCQTRALSCGLLHVLLNLVQSERGTALAKCLYAISCVCREFAPACQELIAQGGCQILVKLLSAPEPAARTKTAFLVRYFCQHYSEARKLFIRENIVKIIAGQIEAGRDESTEYLLSVLQVLVSTNDATILRLCRDPRYNLKKSLKYHLQREDLQDDRYREEKEYCNELLVKLFGNRSRNDVVEERADR